MLCNVALNGLEKAIILDGPRSITRNHPNNKVYLVRYADDFVILAPHKSGLEKRIKLAKEFLGTRGLELSKKKSKIVTVFQGFDYLGFNIRKLKHDPKKQLAKSVRELSVKQSLGYTLVIKVSDKKVLAVKKKMKAVLEKKRQHQDKHQDKDQQFLALILELNPIIIGWRNYFAQSYMSIWALQSLNEWLHMKKIIPWLKKLLRSRNNGGSVKIILSRFNKSAKNWKSRLGVDNGKDQFISLHRFYDPDTHSSRSMFNKRPLPSAINLPKNQKPIDVNPYTTKGMEWWENREYTYGKTGTKDLYKFVTKLYNNSCGLCLKPLGQDGEATELHRIKPGIEGGKYTRKNVMPVHKFCHSKLHSKEQREQRELRWKAKFIPKR